jgi:hypothetical protein
MRGRELGMPCAWVLLVELFWRGIGLENEMKVEEKRTRGCEGEL